MFHACRDILYESYARLLHCDWAFPTPPSRLYSSTPKASASK